MNRRFFIQAALSGLAGAYLAACKQLESRSDTQQPQMLFMSVQGAKPVSEMGLTLTHEHLFADLRSYSEQMTSPLALNFGDVVATILPHLMEIQKLGVKTFIDCTAVGMGRNPPLLKALSKASGMNIVTTTGAYLSAELKFKPDYFDALTAAALAEKWINEWRNGIDDTGIKPGMIKIAVSGGPLTGDEKKLVNAATLAHKGSGMVIGCHVGPWSEVKPGFNGTSALEQVELLSAANVSPQRWIWIHAQNEADYQYHQKALLKGAWISYDGYRPDQTQRYLELITRIKAAGYLNRLLVSQDTGWYTAAEPKGGTFNSFAPVITDLIPALTKAGFTADDVAQIFVRNPAEAFQLNI